MTEVDDVAEFARRWVPLALSRVKPSGRAYIFVGAYPDELHAYLSVLLEQGLFTLDNVLSWTYRNVIGPSPTHGYRLNWQACLYLYGPKAAPLIVHRWLNNSLCTTSTLPTGVWGTGITRGRSPTSWLSALSVTRQGG